MTNKAAIIVLRSNVDRENVDSIPEYLELMKAHGFDDPARFLFDLAPVHSWNNDVSAIAFDTERAAVHEVEWMRLMNELGLPFGILPTARVGPTCVATDPNAEVIDSFGNLMTCIEFPLTAAAAQDIVGNIAELAPAELRPRGQFDFWDSIVAAGDVPCSTCALRAICRGACPKQWSEGVVACPTLKLNFDSRVDLVMQRNGYAVAG